MGIGLLGVIFSDDNRRTKYGTTTPYGASIRFYAIQRREETEQIMKKK